MIRAFLDASVLFAAAASSTGASREIIRLGVLGHVDLWASDYVLEEVRRNILKKQPAAILALDSLLGIVRFQLANPTKAEVLAAAVYTQIKDAPVVAAAKRADAAFLASLDRKHLADNTAACEGSGLAIVLPQVLLEAIRKDRGLG
jgi:predicted nucleic acid-binding protein